MVNCNFLTPSIDDLHNDLTHQRDLFNAFKNTIASDYFTIQYYYIEALHRTDQPFDPAHSQSIAASCNGCLPELALVDQVLCYLFGHYMDAFTKRSIITKATIETLLPIQVSGYYLFEFLTCSALYSQASIAQKIRYRFIMRKALKNMRHFSTLCHVNFYHRHALMSAEAQQLFDRTANAELQYRVALNAALDTGNLMDIAITYECFARFYINQSNPSCAIEMIHHAKKAFTRWGAHAKVLQLDQINVN